MQEPTKPFELLCRYEYSFMHHKGFGGVPEANDSLRKPLGQYIRHTYTTRTVAPQGVIYPEEYSLKSHQTSYMQKAGEDESA